MADSSRGDIRKISHTSFIWKVSFIAISKKGQYNMDSPEFEFEGDTWHLNLNVCDCDCDYEHRDDEDEDEDSDDYTDYTQIRLVRNSVDSHSCTRTYSLCIKDIEEQDYWTSPILTEVFTDGNYSATVLKLLQSNLQDNASKIVSSSGTSIQLTFHPPPVELSDKSTQVELSDKVEHKHEDVDKLLLNFRDLLLNGQKSDVTLHVKGKEFKVHQNILMCRSPVFCKMFDHDMVEQISGSVQITDCSPEVFDVFLLYMYTGQIENVSLNNVVELYCIADKYDVKELATGCVSFMISNMCVESFCNFISVALSHCEQELIDSGNSFFAENMKEIVVSENWKTFNVENPGKANELFITAFGKGNFTLFSKQPAKN